MRALLDLPNRQWMEQAACAHHPNPSLWFPERGGDTNEARAVCKACPVRADCLDYALDNSIRFGLWGGYSEKQRRRFRRDVPELVPRRPQQTRSDKGLARPRSKVHL